MFVFKNQTKHNLFAVLLQKTSLYPLIMPMVKSYNLFVIYYADDRVQESVLQIEQILTCYTFCEAQAKGTLNPYAISLCLELTLKLVATTHHHISACASSMSTKQFKIRLLNSYLKSRHIPTLNA